jgi:RNA polymerase sigma-70 factor (ECF subfamily)
MREGSLLTGAENMDKLTDRDLLTAARAGSEHAFRMLFERYWTDLFKIGYQRLRSVEDTKDLLQDVFLSLWNNIHSIEVEGSMVGYLYTALRNKVFNFYEKKNTRFRKLMQRPFLVADSEDHIFSNYCAKELKDFIAAGIADLPDRMRQIFLLSKEDRLTNAEIASLLQLSEQTVKNQLHGAMKRLKGSLANSGFPVSALLPALLIALK